MLLQEVQSGLSHRAPVLRILVGRNPSEREESKLKTKVPIYLLTFGVFASCGPAETDTESSISERATLASWNVPYISQLSYANIGESACAPTSVTMLLRHLFPRTQVDVPEVYAAGTQSYGYHGPYGGYQNISNQSPNIGISAVPGHYREYYSGASYTGAVHTALVDYLENTWGLNANYIGGNTSSTHAGLYTALESGPALVRVYAHGNTSWGHWMVALGVDDKGTSSLLDDVLYFHDPFGRWNSSWDNSDGVARSISYSEFFNGTGSHSGSAWFRGAITVDRPSNPDMLVSDNSTPGLMSSWAYQGLNQGNWWRYYGTYGNERHDYAYPYSSNQSLADQWFFWPSVIDQAGWYDVTATTMADNVSGTVSYRSMRCNASSCNPIPGRRSVSQRRSTPSRLDSRIGRIYLEPGDQMAALVPLNSNVDAIRFEQASAPVCQHRCADYDWETSACGDGWRCHENGCIGWQNDTCNSCKYQCSQFGMQQGECGYGGWRCAETGCLVYEGGC